MKFFHILISILIAQLAGILGSIFTGSSVDTWYATIARPEWAPPNWLFGPVWITLYTLMGISAYMVWKSREEGRSKALKLYATQLVLNALWTPIFFGLENPRLALLEIVILLVFIVLTTISFYRVRKVAGLLLLPYLAWVSFATILNASIVLLN